MKGYRSRLSLMHEVAVLRSQNAELRAQLVNSEASRLDLVRIRRFFGLALAMGRGSWRFSKQAIEGAPPTDVRVDTDILRDEFVVYGCFTKS